MSFPTPIDPQTDEVWNALCKDESYPCQYCKRNADCGSGCERWEKWVRQTWHKVAMAIALQAKKRERPKIRIWR